VKHWDEVSTKRRKRKRQKQNGAVVAGVAIRKTEKQEHHISESQLRKMIV
jgi:hypothetical protein